MRRQEYLLGGFCLIFSLALILGLVALIWAVG